MSLKKIIFRLALIFFLLIFIEKEQTLYNLWSRIPITNQKGEFLTYQHYLDFVDANFQEKLPREKLSEQGYWLWWQRVCFMGGDFPSSIQQNAFEQAAYTNTKEIAINHYNELPERQAYYRWANDYFTKRGIKVKWMNAADKTVGNLSMALMPPVEWLGYTNKEIQQFIIKGNKVILDDMMPRIKDLAFYENFSVEDALKWDAQLLADEQTLIQPFYKKLSVKSISMLERNIERFYGVKINLIKVEERWSFGMHLMGYVGILPTMMPNAKGNWQEVIINL